MGLRHLVYRAYTRSLRAELAGAELPHHVGVILDGNRRWARAWGRDAGHGHRAGADKVLAFLGWCRDVDVRLATLWLLSTDNLARPAHEVRSLLAIITDLVDRLAATGQYRLNPVGALDLLPDGAARRLKAAAAATEHLDAMTVNVAVGYGGRREITDAVRSLLHSHAARGTSIEELADVLDVEHIAEHLYTRGQPDPDLVIRTSGEQRLSGFLLWQSAHSEVYFCEAMWPEFREVDFLRALRSYSRRERRYGT
ncbi:MAG: isoprenyl transferase [Kineosporiaceae bacterium]